MYEENNNNSNVVSTILKIIIALLLVILSIKVVSIIVSNRELNKTNNYMQENLIKIDEVAKKYFTEDKIPASSGDTIKISLESLIKDKLLEEIKDDKGNICNMQESFIQFIRLDNEYQIKSYLVCNEATDYINTFIDLVNEETTTKQTTTTKKVTTTTAKKETTTTTTKKITTIVKPTTTTTKKITTTTKKYLIEFNANGGNEVSSILVSPNGSITLPIPVRDGYTFVGWYLNNQKITSLSSINQDYVLIAKWTKN